MAWEDLKWNLDERAKITLIKKEDVCASEKNIIVHSAQFTLMEDCMDHCLKTHGRAPSLKTQEDWEYFKGELLEICFNQSTGLLHPGMGKYAWGSITDSEEEGIYRDFYTGEKIANYDLEFFAGNPNGGREENCILIVLPSGAGWLDWYCFRGAPTMCPCIHEERPYLYLRGLCPDSKIDTLYLPFNQAENGEVVMQGGESSKIYFDGNSWALEKYGEGNLGKSDAVKVTYALGKHTWSIENDDCNKGHPYTTPLKLSGCRVGEFTCTNGLCIEMGQRCDQLKDCEDNSDEMNCRLVHLGISYNKKIAPVSTVSVTNRTILPVFVNVSLVLYKVIQLEEANHVIELQYEIILEWYENRARYHNLKKEVALNSLRKEEIEDLWIPYIIYDNTDMKDAVKLNDDIDTTVTITREGNFSRSPIFVLDEIEIFKGNENKINLQQTYSKVFQCKYLLQKYPFDTQVRCRILMY